MNETYTTTPPLTSETFTSSRRFLLLVWAICTVIAVGFVALFGTNAPYADEWEFVPALLGEEPFLPWLWQQHNEHRMPLPRAIYFALFQFTNDFRAGMLLQVVILSTLALVLMRFTEHLRGKPHWCDLFFPVSLLNIGHWENLIMGYQICFVLFALLATALAVTAMQCTRENAFRTGITAGILLMMLALTGGSGLVVAPLVSAWLAVLAVRLWRGGENGRAALVFVLGLLPAIYLAVYFVDYSKPLHHPDACLGPAALGVAGEVLAMALGIGVREVWPAALVFVVCLGIATLRLLVTQWHQPERRLAISGLIAVTAAVTGVAAAIGVGRGEWGAGMGLWSRYSLLVWPLLATTYLVWVKARGKWVPCALCLASALAFPANIAYGMANGMYVRITYSAIEADANAGLSAEDIVSRHFPGSTQAGQEARGERAIPMLRAARIGIFEQR